MIQSDKPPLATISFAVCAIPAEPIHSEIAQASLAVTRVTNNANVIDNVRFPAHLTLIISGTDDEGMSVLRAGFQSACFHAVPGTTRATALTVSRSTTIIVALEGDGPRALHERTLDLVEPVLASRPALRPHLDGRWGSLRPGQRSLVLRYGSYKIRESFDPHFTVAMVAPEQAAAAAALCARQIAIPQDVRLSEVQLVDVGHENERWDVLETVRLLTNGPGSSSRPRA